MSNFRSYVKPCLVQKSSAKIFPGIALPCMGRIFYIVSMSEIHNLFCRSDFEQFIYIQIFLFIWCSCADLQLSRTRDVELPCACHIDHPTGNTLKYFWLKGKSYWKVKFNQRDRKLAQIFTFFTKCNQKLDAGGKPSTWFPPGRLVEHIYYI